ncbi:MULTISPECIES: hypothetical protein [unclassified Microcoleus]|uniref:hypothetical protein n=1 Tax=unclassified Microcoleus TaxID=2642155 RepID=UPI002FD2B1D2
MPDLELPVAAILVDREYYSFFKAVQEPSKVLACSRLSWGIGATQQQLLQQKRGYAIWVLEPEVHNVVKPSSPF